MRGTRLLSAMTAFVVASALVPAAAVADEIDHGSSGVLVTVEITPLECVSPCGGELPATGGDAPSLLMWMALTLLAAGLVLLLVRRIRASPGRMRALAAPSPYYVVSGRRAEVAREGLGSSKPAPREGDADGRGERTR